MRIKQLTPDALIAYSGYNLLNRDTAFGEIEAAFSIPFIAWTCQRVRLASLPDGASVR